MDRQMAEKVFLIFSPLTSWNDFQPSLVHNRSFLLLCQSAHWCYSTQSFQTPRNVLSQIPHPTKHTYSTLENRRRTLRAAQKCEQWYRSHLNRLLSISVAFRWHLSLASSCLTRYLK